MQRSRHVTLVAATVFSLLLSGAVLASEDLARTEDLACTVCHDKPGSKLLTDRGKYYELIRSMDGYADLEASFGRCTFCHRRKPGSKKLTQAGRGFANALGGMEALVEWVRDRHPAWPKEDEEKSNGAGETAPETAGDGPLELLPAH